MPEWYEYILLAGSIAFACGTFLWMFKKLGEIQKRIWEEEEEDVR